MFDLIFLWAVFIKTISNGDLNGIIQYKSK